MGDMTTHVARRLFGMTLALMMAATSALAQAPATVVRQSAAPVFTAAEIHADITTLASPALEGRRTGTPGNAKARALIVERFKSLGLPATGAAYELPFEFTRSGTTERGINVAATCRGRGAGSDDRVIAITAHYDHLGIRDGALYHGADDNASGVAVMLALAKQCQQTPWAHDAIFVAFDAEEMGLQGARAFVASPPIAQSRIALNINFDMVGRGDKRELYVAGTFHRPDLTPAIDAAAKAAPFTLLKGHDKPKEQSGGQDDWTSQSDHGAFHNAGIPFLYFGVEDHADYHKPTDTADKITPAFVFEVATTVHGIVTALDQSLPARKQ